MSKSHISKSIRKIIQDQFKNCCAYCQIQQHISGIHLTVDHIIPETLGGHNNVDNLCLACWDCNLLKGTRTSLFDYKTQTFIPLFHPQKQIWSEHMKWSYSKTYVQSETLIGEKTIQALQLNRPQLVLSREIWAAVGWHPPK